MTLRVLDPFADEADWDSYVGRVPGAHRDIHQTSAYARIEQRLGHRAMLAVFGHETEFIMQPFVWQSTVFDGEQVYDITNPYGFGGPVASGNWPSMPTLYLWFMKAWREWLDDNQIVCEFCSLHPLLSDHQKWLLRQSDVNLVPRRQVVVIDLGSDEEILAGISRTRRQGIKKAQNFGVTVEEVDPTTENVQMFHMLYSQSMERLQAETKWSLSPEEIAVHFVGMPQYATLIFARLPNGAVAAAMMMLRKGRNAYAHYMGASRVGHWGIDELMYFQSARIARGYGCMRWHFGGGRTVSDDDSLLAYKRSFSKHVETVYSYFRVFDEERYADLAERKRDEERRMFGAEINSDFTPIYKRRAA